MIIQTKSPARLALSYLFKIIGLSIFLFVVACGDNKQANNDSVDPINTNDPAKLIQRAIENQRIGAYDDAIEELEQALQIDPQNVTALIRVGVVYEEWEKRDEALNAYKKVLEVDPKNVDARFGLAAVYGKLVRNDLAVIELEKVAEDRGDDVQLNFKIAKEYWYLQDIPKTIEFYKKTIKLDPNHLQAHLNLISAYEKNTDWDKAFKQIMITKELAKKLQDEHAISIAEGKLPFIQGRLNLTKEELNRKMQPPFE